MQYRREGDDSYVERRVAPREGHSLRRLLATFLALLLSLAVLLTGGGLLGSLMALRMQHEGFGTGLIGVVMACYSAGFILASLYFGRIITRVGHIRAFAVLAALAAGSTLIYPLMIEPIAWGVMRGVLGFSVAGLYMVVESWLNGKTPREVRGTMLAFYSIATYAALGGGQLLLNTWPIDGFELFNLAALLFAVSLLPVALTRAPSPELVEAKPVQLRRLYQISPLGLVGSAAAGLMSGTYVALGPVFGQQAGLDISQVALFMAAGLVGGLLLQWPVGWISDRVSRRLAIVAVAAAAATMSLLIALLSDSPDVLAALTLLWGGLTFTLYPLSLALSNDFIGPEELIGTGAGLLLVHGIGMMVGPVVVGRLMTEFGGAALFFSISAVGALLAVFGLWRQKVGAQIPVEDQGHFQVMPGADVTPQIAGLDPRVEEPQLEFEFGGGEVPDDVVNSSDSSQSQ